MNLRGVLFLILAFGLAGFTAFFARSWIAAERAAILSSVPAESPPPQSSEVLVAKNALAAGTFVRDGDLAWRPWPAEGLSQSYVIRGLSAAEDFVGSVVRITLSAGEPVTAARVVFPGERGFLAAVLTPGMRAVSVPVNATTGISGFVFPGDRVDLILTMRVRATGAEGGGKTRLFSETLIGDVRVLTIDQKVERPEGGASVAKTATLEVTAKDSEKIALAIEMGGLSLSLRSLAHGADPLRPVAAATGGAGADAIGGNGRAGVAPSFTLDEDVYYMGDVFDGPAGGPRHQVHVLRGEAAEVVAF